MNYENINKLNKFEISDNIDLQSILNINELQNIQDLFADVFGVASVITAPDGAFITRPSNFSFLCNNIIRVVDSAKNNCAQFYKSINSNYNDTSTIVKCKNCGLLNIGTRIQINGKHIANWIIGQVRNKEYTLTDASEYAELLNVNLNDFQKHINLISLIDEKRLLQIHNFLNTFINSITEKSEQALKLINQNIIEQKHLENLKEHQEFLEMSEKKYRSIFENVQDVFYQIDKNGIILDISPSIEQLSDYKRQELIGRDVSTLYYNSNDRVLLLDKLKSEKQVKDYEVAVKSKNGDLKIASINAKLVIDKDSYYIDGALRDITKRKEAEERLKESEERFRAVSENSFNAICIINELGKIVWYNDAALKLSGYTAEEIDSKSSFIELIAFESQEFVLTNFMKFVGGEDYVHRYRFYIQKADGEKRLCEKYMTHFKDIRGIKNLVISMIDITDRVKAEEEIKYTAKRYQALIENSSEGVVLISGEGNFKYASPMARKMFSYFHDDLSQFSPNDLTHPDDLPMVLEELYKVINEPDYKPRIEYRFKDKNGDWIWIESVFNNLLNEETIQAIVINFRDISEHKKNELEILTAKEKAEESERLKTAFLTNMSHEIRTPLNAIIGFSDLLCDPDIDVNERLEFTNIIKNRSHDLLNIISDILDISRIEAKQINIKESACSIKDLIEEIYKSNKGLIENIYKKQIEFALENSLNPDQTQAFVDRELIKKVVNILISNAFKFTLSGNVTLGCKINNNDLIFYVKDTGIGIPKKSFNLIFERFRQVDEGISRKFEGVGLGLAIAKGLAEIANGAIWVESEEHVGSCFYFSMPYKSANLDTNFLQQAQKINEINPRKNLFLIVEDDEPNLIYLKTLLSKINVNFVSAMTGQKALEIFKENKDISAILLDIRLPDINGYELIKYFKEINPEISIIAQTAFAMQDDIKKCQEAGCKGYISKPINKQLLYKIIEELSLKTEN